MSRGGVYFPPPAAGDDSNHTPSSKRLKGFYLLSVSDSLSHNNRRDACTRQVLDLHPRAAGGRTGAVSANRSERHLFTPADWRTSTRRVHHHLWAKWGACLSVHSFSGPGPASSGPCPQPFLPPLLPPLPCQALHSCCLHPFLHHRCHPEAHVCCCQAQRGEGWPSEGSVFLHRARL